MLVTRSVKSLAIPTAVLLATSIYIYSLRTPYRRHVDTAHSEYPHTDSADSVRSGLPVRLHHPPTPSPTDSPDGSTYFTGPVLSIADLPQVRVDDVSCSALFNGDKEEQRKAQDLQNQTLHPLVVVPDEIYIKHVSDCRRFIADRRYAMRPANLEEAVYPLAFSVMLFKDVQPFERLLRAIYRPQNVYCVHVDKKSPASVHAAVHVITRCFENVFVSHEMFDVEWGKFSLLEPELSCMKELLERNKKWKYLINLTGQEFPLKTNWEIVRILKVFNGANNLEGTVKR
jgi:hypothetical protein